jgi:tetratricopeptide (TPR) repeat protein
MPALSDINPRSRDKMRLSPFLVSFSKNQSGKSIHAWATFVNEFQLTTNSEREGGPSQRDVRWQFWHKDKWCVGDLDLIQCLVHLAFSFLRQGKHHEAESLQRKILEWRAKMDGPDNTETLFAMCNLSLTLMSMGTYSEAHSLSYCALQRCRDKLGLNHDHTLSMMALVGYSFIRLGKYREAESLLRQVLNLRIAHLGVDHIDTVHAKELLTSALFEAEDYEEAESLQRQVLEWWKSELGLNHYLTLDAKTDLGKILRRRGDVDGAIELHSEVVDVLIQISSASGQQQLDTIYAQGEYAESLLCAGRCKEAESLLRHVWEWEKNNLGSGNPRTILITACLARTLRELKRYDEAESYYTEALSNGRQALGIGHRDTLEIMKEFAKTLGRQGRFEEALMMDYQRAELEAARD